MSELKFREMTADDIDRFRTLFHDVWGYNRPREFDVWRLFETPHGVCPTAVATDGDRFAASYTVWPITLDLGGKEVLGAQSMDTMTHPDHQGKGLFTKLALQCFDICEVRGIKALYGFPNPHSYPGFVRRLNWDHIGDVWHYVRPLRVSCHPKVPAPLGLVAEGLERLWPMGGDGAVENRRPDWEELAALIQATAEKDACRIARNQAWFDWRYAEQALNGYRWISVRDSASKLAAFAVWGMREAIWEKEVDNRAHLVELFGTNDDAVRRALGAAVAQARDTGAILIETLCKQDATERVLRKGGFMRHRQAPLIARKTTTENLSGNVHNHNVWRIMGGDVDTF